MSWLNGLTERRRTPKTTVFTGRTSASPCWQDLTTSEGVAEAGQPRVKFTSSRNQGVESFPSHFTGIAGAVGGARTRRWSIRWLTTITPLRAFPEGGMTF